MKPEDAKAVAALQANRRAERETTLIYRDLAANEKDEKRRGIFPNQRTSAFSAALSSDRRFHHQHRGPLRGRSGEINDGRRARGDRRLRAGIGLRTNWLGTR